VADKKSAAKMELLFTIPPPKFPDGFSYYPEFISDKEERELLEYIATLELHTFHFQGFEAKRKVASFGYDYSFDRKTLTQGQSIPKIFTPLISTVADKLALAADEFSELLVTQYPIGAVINWHRDAFPFEVVVGLSLSSDCIFRLRPHDKTKQNRKSILSFPVARRSLYVMKGDSRYNWEHSTAPVHEVRYSITLRTLKKST
jgi:alkylated DNA repair dioxygenase AlkB